MARNPMKTAIAVKLAEMDMTQKSLARRMGVAESTISRWVTSPDTLTLAQFRQLNAVLHLPVDAFASAGGFR